MIDRRSSRWPRAGSALGLLALIAIQVSSARAQTPNACALLKSAEVQSLAPAAHLGNGVPSTDPLGSLNCRYTLDGGRSASGALDVTIGEASRWWPGMSAALIKQGIAGMATPRKPNAVGAAIPGVGEAAVFTSESPREAKTLAYLKGHILTVTLAQPNAREMKDQVIALLKSAAARY